MKFTKLLQALIILAGTYGAQADFLCYDGKSTNLSKLVVQVDHVATDKGGPSAFNDAYITAVYGKNIVLQSFSKMALGKHVSGVSYVYSAIDGNASFEVVGQSTLAPKNPYCRPGSRVTCDYEMLISYIGYLSMGGSVHAVQCFIS